MELRGVRFATANNIEKMAAVPGLASQASPVGLVPGHQSGFLGYDGYRVPCNVLTDISGHKQTKQYVPFCFAI